ncbi:phosphonate C-P lyase system protein PhnH [Planococcus sp. ISL-109]|uniref:phosphonate C-P lyase system protein PhnH n=1 Tax=Planococcus sp. ISL-109 TaxID=2819166 RepID=UPI001BE5E0C8|nr:phosphonate C-P lyase system protein PhnH [Planococcus sp. ISL-109]MBT2582236.1 phosphonate C-P lyase system protein PhnH [Planococcus sp. ISL-109]
MAIDQIHDLQQVYRKILHSMSRPGTLSSLEKEAKELDYEQPCKKATMLCAMTLLDAEVTFHILAENGRLIERISEYTSAKYAPIEEADFIIILESDSKQAVSQAMQLCKIGNLIDPQLSSTWIIESNRHTETGNLMLSGPGIEHHAHLQTGMPDVFWQSRRSRIKEYPMGIDLIFVDDNLNVACIPRTTSVTETEVE